ncbi:DNA polymerase III subunit epsilon [Methylovulum psychrotolerans]|jgi:DNA polymerase-3 subunit epsilon|uniref:DNA polymerase III subunit epsilon n=1 Tax=Methylovulum psychrotolerans TaxID=1704499 RepID=A0A1Z4BUW0_9GAMM|nr:DNA polymerase III subunit epsilon [Methylovulum psychrotolerans]ASF45040.1 DNA polymerase III subunit epsilon [Methylovulum psychrotolerans]MBT9096915.1 DNA polymerase III subunit epsilon [Methylovulum psychrotolerans]POZ51104.1 DNA polymerase III subunit epsilon [Methylovulum psychrotolerans]
MATHKFASRLVVLDTETTGLNPQEGHRVIEIGCVELVNRRLTGRHFHYYLNPDRKIDDGAIAVHGITNEFLQDKPRFPDIVEAFIAFIEGAELIIHNAPFDVGFLNHELALLKGAGKSKLDAYCKVFDTLAFARKKHPGQRNSLDALCKRYSIDNSHRELHGALLDSEILADVFLLMTGGQASLLDEPAASSSAHLPQNERRVASDRPPLAVIACSDIEQAEHQQRLEAITKASGLCLWPQKQ